MEKLLGLTLSKERAAVLQCLRYIVANNFLQEKNTEKKNEGNFLGKAETERNSGILEGGIFSEEKLVQQIIGVVESQPNDDDEDDYEEDEDDGENLKTNGFSGNSGENFDGFNTEGKDNDEEEDFDDDGPPEEASAKQM